MGTPKEKFEAAVRVIGSLPKEGSFKPSNELLLRFYSLFKQATQGPCTQPRPGFWDPVSRYKWDAWHSLGDMSSETAMLEYVEELKKVIETMPHTPDVESFLDTLGSFYEVVLDRGAAAESASTADAPVATFAIDEPANASDLSDDNPDAADDRDDDFGDRQRQLNGNIEEDDLDDEFCDTVERPVAAGSASTSAPGGPIEGLAVSASSAYQPPPTLQPSALKQQKMPPPSSSSNAAAIAEALRQTREIRESLDRLQADVDRVHARLDGLEVATVASSSTIWRRLFGNVSPGTLALVLLWPLLLQLLLRGRGPNSWFQRRPQPKRR